MAHSTIQDWTQSEVLLKFEDIERFTDHFFCTEIVGLAFYGVNDLTYNHLSLRVPGEPDKLLIKRSDYTFDEVTASSLLKYDFEGVSCRYTEYLLGNINFTLPNALYVPGSCRMVNGKLLVE